MANKPIKKYKYGKIDGSVWANDYQGKISYSMSFQKSYKDQSGQWKQSTSFNSTDLRDLYVLIGSILHGQVKEFKNDTKPQEPEVVVEAKNILNASEVDEEIPF